MISSLSGKRWWMVPVAVAICMVLTILPARAVGDDGHLSESFDSLSGLWHPVAGNWRATDGAAVADSGPAVRGYSLALRGWRIEADASVASTFSLSSATPATSWGGVQIHRDALTDDFAASGYTAILRANGELAIIRARDGVNVDYLGQRQTSARPAVEPVTLRFSVAGDELTASVGGETLTVTDTRFRGGGISLVAHRQAPISIHHAEIGGLVESDDQIPLPGDCVVPSGESPGESRGSVFVTDERIAAIAQRIDADAQPQASAFDRLSGDVLADMDREPNAPEIWFVPFFYNDPDAHRAARDGLESDANAAYRLALAYRITGNDSYGSKAVTFLDDWSEVACFRTAEDSALAFSYHFPAMVFAAELMRGSTLWTADAEERFAAMLESQALPVSSSIMSRNNNWGSWGTAAAAAIGAYLDDDATLARTSSRLLRLLDEQLDSDAQVHLEVTRNNGVGDYGIWYSHFTLFPNLLTAEIVSLHGEDLFHATNAHGVTLGDAVGVLAEWVDEPESFPYFTGDDVTAMANVRTIDYLRETGVLAHSMSYFELAANHYENATVARLLEEERPMTTIHAAPYLSLTHGALGDLGDPVEPPDTTPPSVTVKDGSSYTVGSEVAGYELISFTLYDQHEIDKVVINGQVKDLTDNSWSDVNHVKPGVLGAVLGENTMEVYDVAGNVTVVTFTLIEPGPVAPAWDAATMYTGGDQVSYDGAVFEAQWWTRNQAPGAPTGPWAEIGAPVPAAGDGARAWTPSWIYTGGETVAHEGHTWRAKWWTRNQAPGDPYGPWEDLGAF